MCSSGTVNLCEIVSLCCCSWEGACDFICNHFTQLHGVEGELKNDTHPEREEREREGEKEREREREERGGREGKREVQTKGVGKKEV